VAPRVVVEVKFAEWTDDGKLRQPIFLGVRDDKNARDVGLEKRSVQQWSAGVGDRVVAPRPKQAASAAGARRARTPVSSSGGVPPVVEQLDRIASDGGDGVIRFGRGRELHVSNLDKVYFKRDGIAKGDLMRYYAEVSPILLKAIKDRPLILKRYPDGIDGPSFFQQNAGQSTPAAVRVADVETEGQKSRRIIGGDLLTLLYTVQIGTIAVHPWQSRLGAIDSADYSTIDLDPADGVPFSSVIELAGYLKKELDQWNLRAALKTSGSRGLHIVMPMPRNSSYSRAAALAERIGARVAEAYPKLATLERRLAKRPQGTIYVDAQQNARGKSVASAYSVRERPGATVSAPLRWTELRPGLTLESFTILTMPARIARWGDLWGESLTARNTAGIIDGVLRGSS
jgi:bifunctional non-homologous end joining protein LigD